MQPVSLTMWQKVTLDHWLYQQMQFCLCCSGIGHSYWTEQLQRKPINYATGENPLYGSNQSNHCYIKQTTTWSWGINTTREMDVKYQFLAWWNWMKNFRGSFYSFKMYRGLWRLQNWCACGAVLGTCDPSAPIHYESSYLLIIGCFCIPCW